MRIQCLQHVPFEGPAAIGDWAAKMGYPLTTTPLFAGAALPDQADFDWLVAMGGPMGVQDRDIYPWLAGEKRLLRDTIDRGKTLVGVCLGAQLIAEALGARVFANPDKEIGWFPIELTDSGRESQAFGLLPARLEVFHWHGDTFDLPRGAMHLARSQACEHQAFLFEGRVLGLQFHVESTPASVRDLVTNCADELSPGPYIQSAERILAANDEDYRRIHQALLGMLESLPA